MSEQKKTISVGIEETAESAIKFVFRFINTIFTIVRYPRYNYVYLKRRTSPSVRSCVLPATFLSIAFFFYTPLVEMTDGLIYDGIWLGDDTANLTAKKLKDNFSLSSIVIVALPGVITIYTIGLLLSCSLFNSKKKQKKYLSLFLYLFGFQCISIVFFDLNFIISDIDTDYRGFGLQTLLKYPLFFVPFIAVCSLLFIAGLILPTVSLLFAYKRMSRRSRNGSVWKVILIFLITILMPFGYTLAANLLPSALAGILPDESLYIDAKNTVTVSRQGDLTLVEFLLDIQNPGDQTYYAEKDRIYLRYKKKEEDENSVFVGTGYVGTNRPLREDDFLTIAPRKNIVKAITFDFNLDAEEHTKFLDALGSDELCHQFDVWGVYQRDVCRKSSYQVYELPLNDTESDQE